MPYKMIREWVRDAKKNGFAPIPVLSPLVECPPKSTKGLCDNVIFTVYFLWVRSFAMFGMTEESLSCHAVSL